MTTTTGYKLDQFLNNDDSIRFRVVWDDGETSDKIVPNGFRTRKEADEFAVIVESCVPGEDEDAPTAVSPSPWIVERTAMQFVIKAPKNEDDYLQKIVAVTAGLQSNNEANAQLIAASPDLLEALQASIEWFDVLQKGLLNREDQPWVTRARAAIAKATGSTSSL